VNKQTVRSRPGWSSIGAVRNGHIFEIKSACILQPGPAALTDGARQIHAILARVVGAEIAPAVHQRTSASIELSGESFAETPVSSS
jgi:iron complex transport system substrate-binding protein